METQSRGCLQCIKWREELYHAENDKTKDTNRDPYKTIKRYYRIEWLIDRLYEHRESACSSSERASTTVYLVRVVR